MIALNGVVSEPSTDEKHVVLTRGCPFCGKKHSIIVDKQVLSAGMRMAAEGRMVQDAFPSLTPDEREFLMTGIRNECWRSI